MATYNWYATASSCPDAFNPKPGWYSGSTFITSSYYNPSTGKPYTPQELAGLAGGGEATSTTIPTGAGTKESQIFYEGKPIGATPAEFSTMSQKEQEAWIKENYGIDVSGQVWGYAPYMSPEQIAAIPARPARPEDLLQLRLYQLSEKYPSLHQQLPLHLLMKYHQNRRPGKGHTVVN